MESTLAHFITRIESLQCLDNCTFPNGFFPSFRVNPLIAYRRPDVNMFFPAITAFTLRSLKKYADNESGLRIDRIYSRVVKNLPEFQNKDGLATYNFWKTKPSKHFPSGHIFRHFDHFRIPDDVDDTALAYLITERTTQEVAWLKGKLSTHANGSSQWINNTYPEYRALPAYSTWFGKNMYVEFDVSVLCNILYCILHYKLPLDQHDIASLEYIRSVVITNRYMDEPFRCAHQYPRTPLIIYHISRLIAAFAPDALSDLVPKLIDDTRRMLATAKQPMDRVILSTSLMRLGQRPARISVQEFGVKEFQGFYFFIAGLLTAYENPMLYWMSHSRLFHMYWICEAHNWALLAEYEALWITFGTSEITYT
jgi:hypothetical protein